MKKIHSTTWWLVPTLFFAAVVGFIGLVAFLQPKPVSADAAKYYLDCPTTEVR